MNDHNPQRNINILLGCTTSLCGVVVHLRRLRRVAFRRVALRRRFGAAFLRATLRRRFGVTLLRATLRRRRFGATFFATRRLLLLGAAFFAAGRLRFFAINLGTFLRFYNLFRPSVFNLCCKQKLFLYIHYQLTQQQTQQVTDKSVDK